MLLEEKLPLDVGHVLSEGEADTDGESEVHPEADTVGVCEALAVGVCEAVSHTEADCDRVPLGEKLPLDVEQMVSGGEPDTEDERELRPDAEADGESVSIAVGVRVLVENEEGDCDRVPLGEKLPLDVEHRLSKGEEDSEDESELRAETDA